MLAVNVRKPKRERLTRIRVFEELRALRYDGGYDAVRRYAASWSKEEQEAQEASAAAYVPLTFDPSEAYQFDWSHEIVVIDGATTTVKVAHVRLCHSRMLFVRADPREVSRWNAIGPSDNGERRWFSTPTTRPLPSLAEPALGGFTTT